MPGASNDLAAAMLPATNVIESPTTGLADQPRRTIAATLQSGTGVHFAIGSDMALALCSGIESAPFRIEGARRRDRRAQDLTHVIKLDHLAHARVAAFDEAERNGA